MRKIYVTVFLTCALFNVSTQAQVFFNTTVGAEFSPDVYGQISVGNAPTPPVLYQQPVVGGQAVFGAPPMYVYVPLEETQNWGYFCGKYRACGMPVFFVQYDERHPYWARYHEAYRVPYRGGMRVEERREPMREERHEQGKDRERERERDRVERR